MADVVFTALGGKKNRPRAPETAEEAEAMFGAVFGGAAVARPAKVDPFNGLDGAFQKMEKIVQNE